MDFIWIILLGALGAAMLFAPGLFWKMEHYFTVKNGEPTEFYLVMMRIGGVLFLILLSNKNETFLFEPPRFAQRRVS